MQQGLDINTVRKINDSVNLQYGKDKLES